MTGAREWRDGERQAATVVRHCKEKGYAVERSKPTNGRVNFDVTVAGPGSRVRISFDDVVFELTFPGGYNWAEFAQNPEDGPEALADALAFVDAYADPATREVHTKGRLRRPRPELHVSNGAVLRKRGWSSGPPQSAPD